MPNPYTYLDKMEAIKDLKAEIRDLEVKGSHLKKIYEKSKMDFSNNGRNIIKLKNKLNELRNS